MTDPARGPTTEELRARVLEAETSKHLRDANPEPCPESHYWFAFWLRKGWAVTCTRCGTTERPPAEPLDIEKGEHLGSPVS